MSGTDFWDARYGEAGYAYGTEPNAFLAQQRARLQRGMHALAVADGEGRNGVWLAEQGLDVLSVDASEVGLRKARALAASRGVALRTACVDLASWTWPVAAFDMVVSIFAHFAPALRARLHGAMYQALKPGGLLILEAFTPAQLRYRSGGPRSTEMLYSAELLRGDLAEGETLLLEETEIELDEGPHHSGRAAVVRLLLRRTGTR
jgi:SAM-dependent methyltransferase